MIKRTLYFGNPVQLRLKLNQLSVIFENETIKNTTIPFEDIGLLILDHPQITVSQGVMNALIELNAAVLWCSAKHLPHGMLLNLAVNDTFSEKLRAQLTASEPLKKQLWKQTIQCKIANQAAVLKQQGFATQNMEYWESKVGSGDPDNYEGRAAAYYWGQLFDDNFRRQRFGDAPNNLLNYGYAVLRAIVARSLVASGCIPVLGIHHRNKYNAYCLADDIMEPYRPYVDALVLQIIDLPEFDMNTDLSPEIKRHLLQIPVIEVYIDKQKSPLMVAMQRTTSSLMKCFEGETRKILYPIL